LVNLKQGDFLAFPITCVLGVIHGPNWDYKSNASSKEFEENDIQLVVNHAQCTRTTAIQALVENRDDLAQYVCSAFNGSNGDDATIATIESFSHAHIIKSSP
jgi:hypothetical protein